MNVKELFSDQLFNRKLLRLAFPITLQNLMLALVAAAAAIMLGRVSQNAMAAVNVFLIFRLRIAPSACGNNSGHSYLLHYPERGNTAGCPLSGVW